MLAIPILTYLIREYPVYCYLYVEGLKLLYGDMTASTNSLSVNTSAIDCKPVFSINYPQLNYIVLIMTYLLIQLWLVK